MDELVHLARRHTGKLIHHGIQILVADHGVPDVVVGEFRVQGPRFLITTGVRRWDLKQNRILDPGERTHYDTIELSHVNV